jgi:hypothetical protein
MVKQGIGMELAVDFHDRGEFSALFAGGLP